MKEKVDDMFEGLGEIIVEFKNLPGNIYQKVFEALKLVFIPDKDFLTEKIDSVKEALGWYSDIENNASVIYTFIKNCTGEKPPVINVTVPAKTTGKWKIDGYRVHIDFSWYAPYKPDVDVLLGAILLTVFAFNLFKNLPGIISGTAAVSDLFSSIGSDSSKKGE